MNRYKVTYYKEYQVETHTKNDAVGITDQNFTNHIREMASSQGTGKIALIFKFKVEKIK